MYFYYTILAIIGIGSLFYLYFSALSLIRVLSPSFAGGAIFVPTPNEAAKAMIRLANIHSDDIIVDLGSGDGKLLIAAAKSGAKKAIGYEIQHWLVNKSRENAITENLENKVEVVCKSFWHADVSNTTVVLLYQISYAMKGLEEKLQKELPVGARVVSNGFKFPNWKENNRIGNVRLYIRQ
jgi:hypothetical protein